MEPAPVKIFSGTNSRTLAENICQQLNLPLGNMIIQHFADGEFAVSYEESIRGSHVFLVQSTFPNADNLLELLLMVDAAKRASAKTINAVIPYFGWARQDRKDKPRVSIGAKLIADMLSTAGITRLITMDLHADQIQGFFNVPVDHLYASYLFVPYIKSLNLKKLVIATPDVGGSKRANSYAKYLDCPMVQCYKTRTVANEISSMKVIGDVFGKNVILVDDMIDTAGTITKAAELLMKEGAISVRALASHPLLSGPAHQRITDSPLCEVISTDSIPLHKDNDKMQILSVAELFAMTITKVYNNESISTQFL